MHHGLEQSGEFGSGLVGWSDDHMRVSQGDPLDFGLATKPDTMLDGPVWGQPTTGQTPGSNFQTPSYGKGVRVEPDTPSSVTSPMTPMSVASFQPVLDDLTSVGLGGNVIPLPLHFEPFTGEIHPDIAKVRAAHNAHNMKLEQIRSTQKAFVEETLENPDLTSDGDWQARFSALDEEHKSLKGEIDDEVLVLYNLNQTTILDPSNIHSLYWLHSELHIQLRQLELFHAELQSLLAPGSHNCFAAIVVIKQPFPEVVTKNKQLGNDALVVKLLSGSNTQFISVSPIQCILVSEQAVQTKATSDGPPLQNAVHALDLQTWTAAFPVKFTQGSRRCRVTLRFSVDVTMMGRFKQPVVATIESNATNPLIVTTNESQWEGSEQILLKSDVFGGMLEATWPQFCNTLQRHFLRATRQDSMRPKRSLSLEDFSFFHTDFFQSKSIVTQADFDTFWTWFGKTLQVLRFQRYIGALWQQGLLYGCMQRDDVETALSGQPPGTFIIRFSMKYPGQFGIAYVREDQVKHYLVGQNDTAGSKKTLPDFVNEHPQFLYLLQLTSDHSGRPILVRSLKGQCLAQFLSAPTSAPKLTEDGYEGLN